MQSYQPSFSIPTPPPPFCGGLLQEADCKEPANVTHVVISFRRYTSSMYQKHQTEHNSSIFGVSELCGIWLLGTLCG